MHPLVEQLTADKGLPREAIAACLQNIEAVAPDLLALVSKAANGPLEESEENPCFIGLHILAAARDRRLFEPLVRLLRRPSEEIKKLLGDADTMTLPRIVVGCFDGNVAELFALLRDPAVNEYTRDSLFRALAFLTWEGRIDRAAAHDFVDRFGKDRPVPEGDFAWFSWSRMTELLGWSDQTPEVEQAYADHRMPPEFSEPKLFHDGLAEALAAAPDDGRRFEEERVGYLDDVMIELEQFSFTPIEEKSSAEHGRNGQHPGNYPPAAADDRGPAHNPMRNVGRNDPCPCGSGKKYKKCCGAAA